jgi:hypothetical protein
MHPSPAPPGAGYISFRVFSVFRGQLIPDLNINHRLVRDDSPYLALISVPFPRYVAVSASPKPHRISPATAGTMCCQSLSLVPPWISVIVTGLSPIHLHGRTAAP